MSSQPVFRPAQEEEQTQIKIVCASCRKPTKKRGSMTAWIFSSSFCGCSESPSQPAIVTNPHKSDTATPEERRIAESAASEESVGLEQGLQIPEFDILEAIGSGGMGTVYKAKHRKLGKIFAIKVLRPEFITNKIATRRFEQEALAAGALTHVNLVSLYEYGRSAASAQPYLVMDFVEGPSLSQVLQQEQFLAPHRALNIFLQIAEALEHAHRKGVIHRDLKPSNILLARTENGQEIVKIVDFGIAKVVPTEGASVGALTQTGDIFGSPLYMSPEQCQGDTVGTRSDIYSFGCLMYECLAGRPPFTASNSVKIILQHISDEPKPLHNLKETNQLIPASLSELIMICLRKKPQARPSADRLLSKLQEIYDALPIDAGNTARHRKISGSTSLPPLWLTLCICLAVAATAGLALQPILHQLGNRDLIAGANFLRPPYLVSWGRAMAAGEDQLNHNNLDAAKVEFARAKQFAERVGQFHWTVYETLNQLEQVQERQKDPTIDKTRSALAELILQNPLALPNNRTSVLRQFGRSASTFAPGLQLGEILLCETQVKTFLWNQNIAQAERSYQEGQQILTAMPAGAEKSKAAAVVLQQKALLLTYQGQTDPAKLREAKDTYERLIPLLHSVLGDSNRGNQALLCAYLEYSDCCTSLGYYQEALALIQKAKHCAATIDPGQSGLQADCLYHEGFLLMSQRNYEPAYKNFLAALQIQKRCFAEDDEQLKPIYMYLSATAKELSRNKEAIDWLMKQHACHHVDYIRDHGSMRQTLTNALRKCL